MLYIPKSLGITWRRKHKPTDTCVTASRVWDEAAVNGLAMILAIHQPL